MSTHFDKYSCLQRAKDLLDRNDDSCLRYVCLELRFCLEVITYDKLSTYANRLPASVLRKWQPPQALKALLEYEPYADQNYVLNIFRESSLGVTTDDLVLHASHSTLKLSWLRKTYNKLGSYLHMPPHGSSEQLDCSNLRKSLQNMISELEPVISCKMDTSIATTVTFECTKCNDQVIVNSKRLKHEQSATCLNPNCNAEFAAIEYRDNEFCFTLKASTFRCLNCGEDVVIENRLLGIGYGFECNVCKETHIISDRQWGYSLSKDNDSEIS